MGTRVRTAVVVGMLGVGAAVGSGCGTMEDGVAAPPSGQPAAPRAFEAYYHARAVHLSWELAPQWNGEAFRIYSRRTSDASYFMIAEVTNCAGGRCTYADVNVSPGSTYLYYVAAVSRRSGVETATVNAVQVQVPQPVPPPVPAEMQVIALDGANYLRWSAEARTAGDFSHYRVWFVSGNASQLLGETDSEGFLDLLAQNGSTYTYFVTSVDAQGHESQGSPAASGTPRPDYHNEWVYDHFTVPARSAFRFRESEDHDPILPGTSSSRHFRFEVDDEGWWLVPGPNTAVYPTGFQTTALRCGVAADRDCVSLDRAPTSGYGTQDLGLAPQTTYVLRVRGDDGQLRYGVIRVQLLGTDGNGRPIMIFDWAYQLQPGNPALAPTR